MLVPWKGLFGFKKYILVLAFFVTSACFIYDCRWPGASGFPRSAGAAPPCCWATCAAVPWGYGWPLGRWEKMGFLLVRELTFRLVGSYLVNLLRFCFVFLFVGGSLFLGVFSNPVWKLFFGKSITEKNEAKQG